MCCANTAKHGLCAARTFIMLHKCSDVSFLSHHLSCLYSPLSFALAARAVRVVSALMASPPRSVVVCLPVLVSRAHTDTSYPRQTQHFPQGSAPSGRTPSKAGGTATMSHVCDPVRSSQSTSWPREQHALGNSGRLRCISWEWVGATSSFVTLVRLIYCASLILPPHFLLSIHPFRFAFL